jgi:hypothetical protein
MTDMNNDRNHAPTGRVFYFGQCSASGEASVDCCVSSSSMAPRAFVSPTKTVATLLLLCAALAVVGFNFLHSLQGTDFPDFYCAARMLAQGQGHQLYNPEVQRQCQGRYAGRIGTLYIHPPFEALLYLAVAWLPMQRAYLLWSLLSLACLAATARRLTCEALLPWDWRFVIAVSLTFVPLLLSLIQGQDSLLLLLLIVLAFTDLRQGRAFVSGCWLGLGLFKFQLILPIALVLVFTQSKPYRNALAKAFILVGLALAGVSAVICGWSVFLVYPKFLAHLQQQPFAGLVPQAMANFRGLDYLFLPRNSSWASGAVLIFSAAAFIKTLTDWNRTRIELQTEPNLDAFDLAFASTVLFTLMVSYHLNPHDLSLSLLPISLILRHQPRRRPTPAAEWVTLALLGILFLPPLHLWALNIGAYTLVAIPMLTLFLINGSSGRQNAATPRH